MTASENLAFFGKMYGLSGKRLKERVDWGLQLSELTERRGHRVSTFSGGMKRRLNLAAALIHEPSVALLDEPTVGVDPQSRNHLIDTIDRLRFEGLTVVLTTHYMEEASRLCDRIGIMDQGRLLEIDGTEALVKRHGGGLKLIAEFESGIPECWDGPGELMEGRVCIQTDEPLEAMRGLLECESRFATIQIRQPDLETVFLKLTRRTLRD